MDNFVVDWVNILTIEPLKVHPVNFFHHFILLFTVWKVSEPQHRKLQTFPQFNLPYFLNQFLDELGESLNQMVDFPLHVILPIVNFPLKLSKRHHLMHQTLIIYMTTVFNTKNSALSTAPINSNIWLATIKKATV